MSKVLCFYHRTQLNFLSLSLFQFTTCFGLCKGHLLVRFISNNIILKNYGSVDFTVLYSVWIVVVFQYYIITYETTPEDGLCIGRNMLWTEIKSVKVNWVAYSGKNKELCWCTRNRMLNPRIKKKYKWGLALWNAKSNIHLLRTRVDEILLVKFRISTWHIESKLYATVDLSVLYI
jgi:hypothetical protein